MKEGEATRKLKRALEEHPRLKGRALVQRHVNTFYNSGTLDLSVSIGEYTLWLELKIEPRELTTLQALTVAKLKQGAAVVTFSKDCKSAVIADISMAGWLAARRKVGRKSVWEESELVEEIVSRCVDNKFVAPELYFVKEK